MRIGIFTHSTIPRGGVVHAVELADRLAALGHDATVIAPGREGSAFFRDGPASRRIVGVTRGRDLAEDVAHRIEAIAGAFASRDADCFDVWHAQDPISANALSRLRARGRIAGFVRTVHHVDTHGDPQLDAWQRAGIADASRLFCVSRLWRTILRERHGAEADIVGNGVDRTRFSPHADARDTALAARLGLAAAAGPIFLSIGGIEHRKNSVAILDAFIRIHAERPSARLVIAGGASLLDHAPARAAFERMLSSSTAAAAVIRAGVVDDDDMPALYRLADALVFPSRAEGFGLCPLEAMASGRPVIVSAIPPFTEHFDTDDCLWADPDDVGSIATAMRDAVSAPCAARYGASGDAVAARFDWSAVALRHLELYAGERHHA